MEEMKKCMRGSNPITAESWIETSFRLGQKCGSPRRGPQEAALDDLKERLSKPLLESVHEPDLRDALSWAALEASALAWCSGMPLLTFPVLLEEKTRAARDRYERQERLRMGRPVSLAA